jgi:hypothetical protein
MAGASASSADAGGAKRRIEGIMMVRVWLREF